MGRRALPKIDPKVDASGHLSETDQLPKPWHAQALFGRVGPLEIEVGSGKGLFLLHGSAERVDHDFLGIEISRKYARFAAARLAKHQRPNAHVVHGDARQIFEEFLPDGLAVAVHIYFPDPWWKNRHHKRRIMNDDFLRSVQRVLVPDGTLHFWTDVKEYYDVALELLVDRTSLQGPYDVPARAAEHDLDYRTHFERRMRLVEKPVYRSVFKKEP